MAYLPAATVSPHQTALSIQWRRIPIRLFTGKRVIASLILYFVLLFTLPANKAAFMAEFWSSPLHLIGLNVLLLYTVIGALVVVVRWIRQ